MNGAFKLDPDSSTPQTIELNVEKVAQLFHTLDPFPFPERDLDRDAEEFIVGWARELRSDQPIRILIHLPAAEAHSEAAQTLAASIQRYFSYRAKIVSLDLKELFRIGRRSLAIGLAVLAVCILLSRSLGGHFSSAPMGRFVEESLIILGWVANWRPIEILLYDWWPIVRRRNLFRRLAAADVTIQAG